MKYGTICSKHYDILRLTEQLNGLIGEIQTNAERCLDDGQRMEEGLTEKRNRIEELEDELSGMEADRDYYLSRVNDLEAELQSMEADRDFWRDKAEQRNI